MGCGPEEKFTHFHCQNLAVLREFTPVGHCFIIHLPGGRHCPLIRDSEPIRLLATPTSPSLYMLIIIIIVIIILGAPRPCDASTHLKRCLFDKTKETSDISA